VRRYEVRVDAIVEADLEQIRTWKRSVIIVFRVVDDEHRVDVVGIFYRGRDVRTALSERLKD
jgi:hypothetical protein